MRILALDTSGPVASVAVAEREDNGQAKTYADYASAWNAFLN